MPAGQTLTSEKLQRHITWKMLKCTEGKFDIWLLFSRTSQGGSKPCQFRKFDVLNIFLHFYCWFLSNFLLNWNMSVYDVHKLMYVLNQATKSWPSIQKLLVEIRASLPIDNEIITRFPQFSICSAQCKRYKWESSSWISWLIISFSKQTLLMKLYRPLFFFLESF